MRNVLLYLVFSLIIIAGSSFIFSSDNDLDKKWQQVKKFEKEGLPRSAMEVVDEIYGLAKLQDNQPQVLKAMIYKVSLQSRFEEDHLLKAISSFQNELVSASTPEKQILHSLIAEMYLWYYQANRWQINARGTVVGYNNDDIKTWDAQKLTAEIKKHYLLSLEERSSLGDISLDKFEVILTNTEQESYQLWPTLYDLLANRALIYLSGHEAVFYDFGPTAKFNTADYLAPSGKFTQLQINPEDNKAVVLQLYQHLLQLHADQGNEEAFVDLDLRRLQYVFNNSNQKETDEQAYIKALEDLLEKYDDNRLFVKVSEALARQYLRSAARYNPKFSDDHRYDLITAEKICEAAIAKYPIGKLANGCKTILSKIREQQQTLQLESVALPDEPYLAKVKFKNITKLYFKAVAVDPINYFRNKQWFIKDTISDYLSKPAVTSWDAGLPDTEDHQMHSGELIFPRLNPGYYFIFASTDADFRANQNTTWQMLRVSELAFLSKGNTQDGSLEVFVRDRETGLAVENARVTTYDFYYNEQSRKQEKRKTGESFTDENGFAKTAALKDNKRKHIVFTIEKNGDFIDSEGGSYLSKDNKDTDFKTKTYLFTDRSIYRPGQTVYFKGLVTERNADEVRIRTDFDSKIGLIDRNKKMLGSLDVKTNEFGSFEGSFVLPTGGLNGVLTLKMKTGSATIRMEEYKRPTFLVTYDTIRETFKLGDQVTVQGLAETFSGTPVSGAKVNFRVVQTPMIIPYYRYFYPFPESQEITIAQGTVATDEKGNFKLTFATEADEGKYTRFYAGQHFTVYADVVDVTGEVQTGVTHVAIGRQPVILSFESAQKILKEHKNQIILSAKNLSGAAVQSDVALKVMSLTPPSTVFTGRYWKKPDLNLTDKAAFTETFRHVAFADEDEMKNWQQKEVYSTTLPVKGSTVVLTDFFNSADPGVYLLKATSELPGGDTARAEQYLTLASLGSKKVPGNVLDWSHVDRKTAEPGEVIKLLVGSAAKKSQVYFEVVDENQLISSGWVDVSRSQKVIEIPVKEDFRGGFEIRTAAFRHNRAFLHTHNISVPYTNKKLEVKLETTRDFLTPGNQEEWQVSISGPGGETLAAELLASMYDASLDQFEDHYWNLALYPNKRTTNFLSSGYFNASRSKYLLWQRDDYPAYSQSPYPQINWFTFSHYPSGRGRVDVGMKSSAYIDETQDESISMDQYVKDSNAPADPKEPESPAIEETEIRYICEPISGKLRSFIRS